MSSFTDSMQNGTTDNAGYNITIEELNRQEVLIRIPTIILLIVTMILGLVGNTLTIYVYGFRLKLSTTYLFVVMLACADLIMCVIATPVTIVQSVYPFMTTWDAICKISMCLNVFNGLCNCSFLVAIAIDRYRKICLPLKAQISMTAAKIITLCIFLFSATLGSVSIIFYGRFRKPTKYPGIYSYTCSEEIKKLDYQLGFLTPYLLYTTFTFIVLIVLYTIILRLVKVTWRKRIQSQSNRKNTAMFDTEMSKVCTKNTACITANLRETDSERRGREQGKRIQRITITAMMITLVYIVTYIPLTVVFLVTAFFKSEDTMSVTAALFYSLARHSFFISSCSNPIIYSCRNKDFIDEVKKIFGIKQK